VSRRLRTRKPVGARRARRHLAADRAVRPLPPPHAKELPKLAANPRAFGQATIRHAVFGIVLVVLEDALNPRSA